MASRPSFFIVGAPKCGTTALADYLGEHPNIFMSSPKEPNFFCPEFKAKQYTSDLENYLALFSDSTPNHMAIGEASVWYLLSDTAARRIHDFDKDARIIIMLRNPVDIVYSLHSQLLWTLDESISDFSAAWELQDNRARGKHIPEKCREPLFLQYGIVGNLGEQISRYFKIFPESNIKVIFFEDFVNATADVYRDVLGFLNVPDFPRSKFQKVNANKAHISPIVARFTQRPPRFALTAVSLLKNLTGIRRLNLLDRIKRVGSKKMTRPPLPIELREKVACFFSADIHLVENLTGRNLTHWH